MLLNMAPLSIENPWLNSTPYIQESPIHDESSYSNVVICKNGPLAPVHEKVVYLPPLERKRRVSFSETVDFREVTRWKDQTNEDKIAAWWTAQDYVIIKRMFKITVHLMMQGETFSDDENDFCARGLEFKTKSGAKRRYSQKQRVVRAVLRAQEFQRCEGFDDPDFIAELCIQSTKSSAKDARSLARSDQLAVQQSG